MVYAVMIHSIDHTTAVWLSMFYTAEGLDSSRKVRERTLASEIRRKFIDLNHAPRGPERQRADWVVSSLESTAISKMSTERAADTVMFKLPPSQLIQEPTTVVSRIVHNCAFTLVLAPHENRSQSLLVLDLLVSILNEHFKNSVIATQPQEVGSTSVGFSRTTLVLRLSHRPSLSLPSQLLAMHIPAFPSPYHIVPFTGG
eukprot:TRINITY_DN8799_c0_g1_i1.p1 TRINITY_DN8799_c0_g1~~TRINITY_DN8799_c0_g1_i1.p1  ORF type:complete len:200 (+),score=8.33 TRINITY_DN8799_c0_g1_i1:53-652(+)